MHDEPGANARQRNQPLDQFVRHVFPISWLNDQLHLPLTQHRLPSMKALLLLLFAAASNAQTFGLHIASAHAHGGYNAFNPGVYARLDNGVTFGTYRNSHSKQSAYLGYTWQTGGALSYALTAGAVTGYERSVSPLLAPSIAYRGIRLGIIPRPMKGGSAALHLMVERHY